jgi:small subunit ribosomal protein S21
MAHATTRVLPYPGSSFQAVPFSAPESSLEASLVEIQLGENDRLDWALKQFRRRMLRSGLFKDMRRKRFYEKPSEARKVKSKAALRRRHKDLRVARRAGQL